jgi:hypothetical protein
MPGKTTLNISAISESKMVEGLFDIIREKYQRLQFF